MAPTLHAALRALAAELVPSARSLGRLAPALLLLAAAALAAAQPRIRVAVLPVVVHSLDQQEYLRSGISDMLGIRLEQHANLTVVRVTDVSQATTDMEAARRAGRELGAQYVVYGSFTRFGEGASLDLRCTSTAAGGEASDPRAIFVHAGSLGEVIPRLDDLAQKVARYVAAAPSGAAPPGAGAAAGAAPAGNAASSEALQDALSELEDLRQRVDRLEEAVHGGGAAAPPGGASKR
jgi:TolB-like protein